MLLPGTAAADVTVAASRAEAGARDVTVTFRVTNDDPAVPTTRLEVFLPTVRPLLGVPPTAPAGWTARLATASPPVPLPVDGEPVPQISTGVTWEGGTVEWSDLVPHGAPEPQHPALVVPYRDTSAVPPATLGKRQRRRFAAVSRPGSAP